MPRLYFSGLVLPERAPLSVSGVHASIVGPDGAAHALIALNIWANQISATVDSEETDVLTLRNLVRAEAEFVTSLAGFLLGFGYDVEITKAFNEDLSQTQVFGIDVAVLTARAQGPVNESNNGAWPTVCDANVVVRGEEVAVQWPRPGAAHLPAPPARRP